MTAYVLFVENDYVSNPFFKKMELNIMGYMMLNIMGYMMLNIMGYMMLNIMGYMMLNIMGYIKLNIMEILFLIHCNLFLSAIISS